MPGVVYAHVTTRSETDASEPYPLAPESVAQDVERTKRGAFVEIPSTTTPTFVPSAGAYLESAGSWEPSETRHDGPELREALRNAWVAIPEMGWLCVERIDRLTRATKPTSTTVSSIAELLRMRHRDNRLRKLSPQRRAMYEDIIKLRDEIDPVDFDIAEALREIRRDE